MKAWLFNLWDAARTSLWFVPLVMIAAAVALGIALPELDSRWESHLPEWALSSGENARAMLGALTSAMLTTAGIVFSVTVVTLSITSSQFGPRLLRSFMQQKVAQVTLGFCLGTSVYSLLLMRVVDKYKGEIFVPNVSILLAMALAMLTLGVIVYFLHSVATSIQPTRLAAAVGRDLDASIDRLFPERIGHGEEANGEPGPAHLDPTISAKVPANHEGYLVAIDANGVLEIAEQHDLVIELLVRPGDFIAHDAPLALVNPPAKVTTDIERSIRRHCLVGTERTPRQDVECAVNELVEVAVRALSPGINAPLTAVVCIDRLGASLARLAARCIPSSRRYNSQGALRVIARPYTFHSVLAAAFDQIRQYGATSVAVTIRMLEALERIASAATRHDDIPSIRAQADMIVEVARNQGFADGDLSDVEERYVAVGDALAAKAQRRALLVGSSSDS
jgi:uncharacterized membrane protein